MTNLDQFTEEEARDVFLEATGSWANIWECPRFEPSPSHELSLATRAYESESSAEQLKMSMRAYLISSIGFHSFVVPYERYKKKKTRHYGFDASTLFGLDKYSLNDGGSRLTQDFRKTTIDTWSPTHSPPKSTWFADMMRNSIAHGQTETTLEAGQLTVAIYNTRDGSSMDFHIVMDANEYVTLVASSLSEFVGNVVAGGRLEPLSTLLDHVAPPFNRVSPRQSALFTRALPVNPRPQTSSLNRQRHVAQPVSVQAQGRERARRPGRQVAKGIKKYYLKAYKYLTRKR